MNSPLFTIVFATVILLAVFIGFIKVVKLITHALFYAPKKESHSNKQFFRSKWVIPLQYLSVIASVTFLSVFLVGQFIVLPEWIGSNIVFLFQTEAICLMIAFMFFLRWHYGTYNNLKLLGLHTETTPQLAIIDYFIPILNIYKPYEHMKYLYQKSLEKSKQLYNPQVLTSWAIGFIIIYVSNIYIKLADRNMITGELLGPVIIISVIGDLLFVICNIYLIKRITTSQASL